MIFYKLQKSELNQDHPNWNPRRLMLIFLQLMLFFFQMD